MQKLHTTGAGAALFVLLLTFTNPLAASASAIPEGFDGFLVYVADGEYDVTTPHPTVPGCGIVPTVCDGEYFWTEILGATHEEMLAAEAEAKDFFLERFGLSIDALVASGDIVWLNLYADPRNNYRVRSLPGHRVHKYGWTVHEGAFALTTTTEVMLGGDFEGTVVPAGTSFGKGQYVIERSRLVHVDGTPVLVSQPGRLVLEFQSSSPILAAPGAATPTSGNCEITSSPWGSGIAMFTTLFTSYDGIRTKLAFRNVILLDGDLGFGRYPGVENDPDLIVLD